MRCPHPPKGLFRHVFPSLLNRGINACLQWSGADYADNLIKTVTGGVSSTSAMGAGVTEAQFTSKL